MSQPLISLQHITKRFGGVTALSDVSFDIADGEAHAIVGENGAGKSTLMKILAGVIPDYDGQFLLRGEPQRFADTRAAEAAGISIIHQELNLVDSLSVAANIFLGREQQSWGWLNDRQMEAEAGRWLAELNTPLDVRTPVGQLRVGDQQLVEIAKALSLNAQILIMDEPTSALTEAEVARLDEVMARLRQRGVTLLYISHKMDEIFRLADRITVLRDGQYVGTLDRAATNPTEIAHRMVGREIESVHFRERRQPGKEVLRVEKLSLPWTGHASKWRLRDISLELREGEVLGIAGLMGAGRTELLECLFGASPLPPQGKIFVDGSERRFQHPHEAMAAGIALVTEDRKRLGLFNDMNVGQNISLCTLHNAVQWGLIAPSKERKQVVSQIDRLCVKTTGPEAAIGGLSGGNQQKTIIGRWLLTRPRVLLLDDPTRGVDVGAKAELYLLIDALCRQGLGVILTSSELPELLTLSDRVLVLCEGEVTAELSRDEANEQRIMEAATRSRALQQA